MAQTASEAGHQPEGAEGYAYSPQTEGMSPDSIRRDLAAASSSSTIFERRHDEIRTPFRGTKAWLEKRVKEEIAFPDPQDVKKLLGEAVGDPVLKDAVQVMTSRGLWE